MTDLSYLDKKYFVDGETYNCPFCNRNNVSCKFRLYTSFNWDNSKICYVYKSKCSSCDNEGLHLSFTVMGDYQGIDSEYWYNIDQHLFYSVPTSFFILDERIPKIVRELIAEAEGCLKMNFLTGASACMRKSIYELLIKENITEGNYDERIKALKEKYPDVTPVYIDVLSHIKDMTSDKVHEQSWDKWNSKNLNLIIETLKNVLNEMYVIPDEKQNNAIKIQKLLEAVKN